jgi:hypothetical protein
MRTGFDPTHRNRNIGTKNQGRGRNNRLTIPSICHSERIWWEQLGHYSTEMRHVYSRELLFIIEKTRPGCIHPCSVDDVCRILAAVPPDDWNGLLAFTFRQSTRKQSRVSPCWGRLAFAADIGQPGKPHIYSGPALIIEAQDPTAHLAWNKSLTPAEAIELERLRADGHRVEDRGIHFRIISNAESMRTTALYRSLLHEIGHWVDWLKRVERPSSCDYEQLALK